MPNLNYSGYDYNTALAQLTTKLEALDGWKDRVNSATGQILLSLLSYVIDMDGFKIDRRAEELYRDYAQLRTSVVAIAWKLGYEARRKVSSVCTLRFSTTSPPVVIPKGTECTTSGGVKFVTTEQGTITLGSVDLAAKQGDPKELSYTGDGSAGQSFSVPESGDDVEAVENTSVEVTVAGVEWTKVDSFVGQTATAQVYTITNKGDSLKIEFGDDKNGKAPENGDAIVLSWLESLGASGDVPGTGTITTIASSGLSGVTVTNTDAAQGGEDEEDIEEIRDNMSTVFAAGERGVTAADYRAILRAYAGVAKATAYGEQETLTGTSNPDYAYRVELVVVPTGGGTLTRTQEDTLLTYLNTLKVVTSYITFKDPTYIYVDFVVRAKTTSSYDIDVVQAAIETALDGVVNFQDVDLGEALRYSDVVAAIEAVDGVVNSTTDVKARYDGGLGDGGVAYSGTIPLVPVSRGKVEVYLETVADGTRRLVGYDDGSGTMTSSASYMTDPRVTGGSVNYQTGVYSLTFNGAVSSAYRIYVIYQTASERTEIFGVGDAAETTFTGFLEKDLAPNFVHVYEEGILVASDDGSGVLVDSGTGRVSTGSVDYDTGGISVTFASAPSSDSQISSTFHYDNQDLEVDYDEMLLMGTKDVVVEVQVST